MKKLVTLIALLMFSFTAMAQIHQGDAKPNHDSSDNDGISLDRPSITTILTDEDGSPLLGSYHDKNGSYRIVGIGETELEAKLNLLRSIEIESVQTTPAVTNLDGRESDYEKKKSKFGSLVLINFCIHTDDGDRCVTRHLQVEPSWSPALPQEESEFIRVPEGLFLRGGFDWTIEHSDAVSIFANFNSGSIVENHLMYPIKKTGKVYKEVTCRDNEDIVTYYYEL